MGRDRKRGISISLFLYFVACFVLATAMPVAGDEIAAESVSAERGRFGIGFQRMFWDSWGVGASVDLRRCVTVQALKSVIGDDSAAGRLAVRFGRSSNFDFYGYGVVGLVKTSEVSGSAPSYVPSGSGSMTVQYLPTWGTETRFSVGAGGGTEHDLRNWLDGSPPVLLHVEVGIERIGGLDTSVIFGLGANLRF